MAISNVHIGGLYTYECLPGKWRFAVAVAHPKHGLRSASGAACIWGAWCNTRSAALAGIQAFLKQNCPEGYLTQVHATEKTLVYLGPSGVANLGSPPEIKVFTNEGVIPTEGGCTCPMLRGGGIDHEYDCSWSTDRAIKYRRKYL